MQALLLLSLVTTSKPVRVHCQDTRIRDCAEQIAELTEKNFIIPSTISERRLSILTGRDVTPDEAFNAFVSALDAHEIRVVSSGAFFKLLPR